MEKDTVVKICGEYPENFKPIDVSNNPNFVFENNSSYPAVQLYDIDENTVFVNSFLECEHYVSGGWDYTYEAKESGYYGTILIFLMFGIIIYSYIKKYILKNEND